MCYAMRLPSVVSSLRLPEWNVRIKELLSNGKWQEAISCYVAIARNGVQPTDSSPFPSIMKASSQISFKQGQLMHACLIKQGYDSFPSVGNSILDFYMKWGNPNSALSVFNRMRNRDSVSWNIIIHGHLDHGGLEAGLWFFMHGRVSGFEPNVSTLVIVAQAYRVLRDFDGGCKFHGFILKSGFLVALSVQNSLLGMYADFDMDSAYQLFDEMCERDVISWSMMIGAYVQIDEPSLALQMFKNMLNEVDPDGLTMVGVLKASGNLRDANMGRSLHGSVISKGHIGDRFIANSLVDMYARCDYPISALRVFNGMAIKNIVSWNSILSGLIHNGMHSEALSLANSMVQAGVGSDEVTLVNFLQLCKQYSEPKQCKVIHCKAIRSRHDSNTLVRSSLIDAYAKCNLIELAWRLFSRTENRDPVTWSTMVGGFAYCGMPDEAVAVFQQMGEIRERIVNPVIILNLVEACAVSADLKRSKWAHCVAIRMGFVTEVAVGTAIVDMYSKCGAVREARVAFDQIPHKNIMSWSTMVSAYGMNGRAQDALTLVAEMKKHNLKPNAVTALSVLAACSHGGLVDSGLSFFKEMVQDCKIQPGVEHYACVIDMLSRSGSLENAMDLIQTIPDNFDSGANIWGSVLSASTRYKNLRIGEGAASRVLELEPFSSSGYLLASSLHSAMGSWADAAKMRRLVKEREVKVIAGYSLVRVDGKAFKFVAGDKCKAEATQSKSIVEQLHRCMQTDEEYDDVFE